MFASAATYFSDYLSGDKKDKEQDTIPIVHASSSRPADIDTAAAQKEYTIEFLAGLNPHSPLAKEIVYHVMGIENASPTMIQDIMRDCGFPFSRSSAPSPQPVDPEAPLLGSVTELEHIPGVNDLMSGVLPPDADSIPPPAIIMPISPQDRIACHDDIASLLEYQQDTLLTKHSVEDILAYTAGISSEAIYHLPALYHTTLRGLDKAVQEIQTGEGMDEVVAQWNALMRRGGEPVEGKWTRVVYAEELVPYVREGEEGYDAEFWESVEVLRRENEESGIADLVAWAAEGER
jgi:hypothetical protein